MMTSTRYTCSAITQWANEILRSSHDSLIQFQPKDVALLLYGILKAHTLFIQSKDSTLNHHHDKKKDEEGKEDFSALLSYCSLQEIQFQSNPSTTTQLRNAEHVLGIVRRLSKALSEDFSSSSFRGFTVISESLTAEIWLDGRAFVEELKLWRWVRELAERLNTSIEIIQHAVEEYIGGNRGKENEKAGGCSSSSSFSNAFPLEDGQIASEDPNPVKSLKGEEEHTKEPLLISKRPRLEEKEEKARTETIDTTAEDDLNNNLFTKLKEVLDGVKGSNVPPPSSLSGDMSNLDKRTEGICSQCPLIFAQALQGNLQYLKTLESQRKAALAACGKKNIVELLAILSSFA